VSRSRKPRPPVPRRRPDADRIWSVDDALREDAKLVRWFDSGDGVRGIYRFYYDFYQGQWPASLPDTAARWQHAEMTAANSADALRAADPIWCDPPMVDLLAAAADTYPTEPIQPHHLLAPDGIVIFAKPLPVVWYDNAGDPTDQRLSAISWAEGRSTTDGRPLLGITGWQRAAGLFTFDQPTFAVRYTGLRPASNVIGPYGTALSDLAVAEPYRILQTLTALCRTPLVRDESAPASKASPARDRPRRSHQPGHPPHPAAPPRARPARTRRRPRSPSRSPTPGPLGPRPLEEPMAPQHRRTPHDLDRRLPPRRLHRRHPHRHQGAHRLRPQTPWTVEPLNR
jgi:hypothetical protein